MMTPPRLAPASYPLPSLLLFGAACILGLLGVLAGRAGLVVLFPDLLRWPLLGALTLVIAYLLWIGGGAFMLRWHHRRWGEAPVHLAFPGVLWGLVIPLASWFLLIGALALLVQLAGGHIPGVSGEGTSLAALPQTPWATVLLIFSAGILAPIAEEMIFRGILLPGLLRWMAAPAALLLSSLLFALAHGQPGTLMTLWSVGIAAGYLTYRSGNLWPAVVFHLANNLAAILFDYLV